MNSVEDATMQRMRAWWYQPELALLVILVLGIYFTRISTLPLAGEECRWATGAREMIATGDWIVWRQQGQVFPEKPPMTAWAMAALGIMRGDVDTFAIRFPSVMAVLLTSLMLYAYARTFTSRIGALLTGCIYATSAQVLEIGRMGESESMFTLFVGSSLLVWHMGFVRQWPRLATWTFAYTLVALGALAKGTQAPAYFGAAVGAFLLFRREWRWLISWQHVAGVAVFAAIVGAWVVPYCMVTDWESVVSTWAGLAADRFTLRGLLAHLATYPLETIGCLLPWSPAIFLLVSRNLRRSLGDSRTAVVFLATALLVTYPTVWFASGARGRYFMPMYPCVAALIGIVIDRCSRLPMEDGARRAWNHLSRTAAIAVLVVGIAIVGVTFLPMEGLAPFRQPWWLAVVFVIPATVTSVALMRSRREASSTWALASSTLLAAFVGLAYSGPLMNHQLATWNDVASAVAEVKENLPVELPMVSFDPVDHRFAYHYSDDIKQLDWPLTTADIPADVTYFCFDRRPTDTPECRVSGRGRTYWTTPGTLPVQWEEVATVRCDRRIKNGPMPEVVVGRIIRQPTTVLEAKSPNGSDRR